VFSGPQILGSSPSSSVGQHYGKVVLEVIGGYLRKQVHLLGFCIRQYQSSNPPEGHTTRAHKPRRRPGAPLIMRCSEKEARVPGLVEPGTFQTRMLHLVITFAELADTTLSRSATASPLEDSFQFHSHCHRDPVGKKKCPLKITCPPLGAKPQ
jgi:hypothetical protein